jgi:hypothetical protein
MCLFFSRSFPKSEGGSAVSILVDVTSELLTHTATDSIMHSSCTHRSGQYFGEKPEPLYAV